MSASINYVPDGFHTVTPYLYIDGAAEAIEFYKKALGAAELYRLPAPEGRIGHAEIQIGNSRIMLADENQQMKVFGPKHYGGVTAGFMVYVEDVDAVFHRAVAAGAAVQRPLADQFYGDRTGGVVDPFGHHWYLATHLRDVSPEEMAEKMKEATQQTAAAEA